MPPSPFTKLPEYVGTPSNPIRLTGNVMGLHIHESPDRKDWILGNAILTNKYSSTVCLITSIKPSSTDVKAVVLTLEDGTSDVIETIVTVRRLLQFLDIPIPVLPIVDFSSDPVAAMGAMLIQAKQERDLVLNTPLPTLAEFVFQYGSPLQGEGRRIHEIKPFKYYDKNGELFTPIAGSEAWFILVHEENIHKGAEFYTKYCLTKQEQQGLSLGNFNYFHPVLDNPFIPIPSTLRMHEFASASSGLIHKVPKVPSKVKKGVIDYDQYFGRNILGRLIYFVLIVSNVKSCQAKGCPANCKSISLIGGGAMFPYHTSTVDFKSGETCAVLATMVGGQFTSLYAHILAFKMGSSRGDSNGNDNSSDGTNTQQHIHETLMYNMLNDVSPPVSSHNSNISNNNNSNSNNINAPPLDGYGLTSKALPLSLNIISNRLAIRPVGINDLYHVYLGNILINERICYTIATIKDCRPIRPGHFLFTLSDGTHQIDCNIDESLFIDEWDWVWNAVELNGDEEGLDPIVLYCPFVIKVDPVYKRPMPTFIHGIRLYRKDGLSFTEGPRIDQKDWYNIIEQENILKGASFYEKYCLTPEQTKQLRQQRQQQQQQQQQDSPLSPLLALLPKTTSSSTTTTTTIPPVVRGVYHPIMDNPFMPIPMTLRQLLVDVPKRFAGANNTTGNKNQKLELMYLDRNIAFRLVRICVSAEEQHVGSEGDEFGDGYDDTSARKAKITDGSFSLIRSTHLPKQPVLSLSDGKYNIIDYFLLDTATVRSLAKRSLSWTIACFGIRYTKGNPSNINTLVINHDQSNNDDKNNDEFILLQNQQPSLLCLWDESSSSTTTKAKGTTTTTKGTTTSSLSSIDQKIKQQQEKILASKQAAALLKQEKENNNDVAIKCTCPKQGCGLHGDDGYNTLNKTKELEDLSKIQDKEINENKQQLNDIQRKIEHLKQRLSTLRKQDSGTPWEYYLSSASSSSSSSTKKQKDNKKQNNKKDNNTKNNNDNNQDKQLLSVSYYKSNPLKYPQYIQDKMLQYKQRITTLRQQVEQRYITIKQNNQKINLLLSNTNDTSSSSNNQPNNKDKYKKLQQLKEEYDMVYPKLQQQHDKLMNQINNAILLNKNIEKKYNELNDIILQKSNEYNNSRLEQFKLKQSNKDYIEFVNLHKILSSSLTNTQDNKTNTNNTTTTTTNNNNNTINTHNFIVNAIVPYHPQEQQDYYQQQDQNHLSNPDDVNNNNNINTNNNNNNNHIELFTKAFCLSQPSLLTIPQQQHEQKQEEKDNDSINVNNINKTNTTGYNILSSPGLLSNYLTLPLQQHQQTVSSLYGEIHSQLYHHFTTPQLINNTSPSLLTTSTSTNSTLQYQDQQHQYDEPLLYKDMVTLYQSYLNIINNNQNNKNEIQNITKHNFIAYLLPHIERLYTTNLLTLNITQYTNIYYEQNYEQYYPNILDYWKRIVSTSTIILYHSLLRLFTLSSFSISFVQQGHHKKQLHNYNDNNNILLKSLPLLSSLQQKKTTTTTFNGKPSSLYQEKQQQNKQSNNNTSNTVNIILQQLIDKIDNFITQPKLFVSTTNSKKNKKDILKDAQCSICFANDPSAAATTTTTTTSTTTTSNTNDSKPFFVLSICCNRMVVCDNCILFTEGTGCAHCGEPDVKFE